MIIPSSHVLKFGSEVTLVGGLLTSKRRELNPRVDPFRETQNVCLGMVARHWKISIAQVGRAIKGMTHSR